MNTKAMALVAVIIAIVAGGYFLFFGGEEKAPDAGGTRWPNGISADSTSPLAGEVRGADFTVTDDIAVSDDLTVSGDSVVEEFTQGGGILTITDANGGTVTLTEAQLLGSNILSIAAGGAGQEVIALTLPATSTMTTLLPNAGDFREWIVDASALAAATTTTITLGTGVDLIAVTTNDDVIDGAEFARLSCWRQADTDVTCITSELLHAD
jgi:hypothetical protein